MSAKSAKADGTHFPHKTGEVVLVKWRDGKIYFAKIKTIEWSKKRCVVIFDDKSQDLARFSWIHDVNETTSDIICVKCKQDYSDKGNEIVLCDQCGYGYHQKCHETKILQRALEDDSIWICYFCEQEMACPYVTNADALTQSLEDIDDQGSKFKAKKRKQSMKIPVDSNKKFCSGLLADSPSVKQYGEEEAIGEHYVEQNTPTSAKSHKKRKSKPYKVEICSSISKEYFVDDVQDESIKTPISSRGRKIKRKITPSPENTDMAPKKGCVDSSGVNDSPSGVGIFSFEMPSEFHSNLHQLAVASQLVSQSASGEVPPSVIKAIENEQKSQQERHKASLNNNREKPTSLVLSIPRSPLVSITSKQSITTPSSLLVQPQPVMESTPSCAAAAIPSPVIISNNNSRTSDTVIARSSNSATHTIQGCPDSVFTYPNPASTQMKNTSTSTVVSDESGTNSCLYVTSVTPNETSTTVSEPHIVTTLSSKSAESFQTSVHPIMTAPVTVTQNGAFFECPPPITTVAKPTSIQFIDKSSFNVKATTMPPKFSQIASSPAVLPIIASVSSSAVPSANTPTIAAASPIIMQNPSTSAVKSTPTPSTPASQPVYYVQINGGTPSQPILIRPIRRQNTQSPVVKVVSGPMLNHVQSSSQGDQCSSHVNGKTYQPTSYENMKEVHTMSFANQVKDMGTTISAKIGATYNMVSEHTLINKFEEAWNKLNELAAKWEQPKQIPAVTKKPTAAKIAQLSPLNIKRDNVVLVAQQQKVPQQISHKQQQTQQQLQQQQQQQMIQQQQTLTPVQLVPISAPHHVAAPHHVVTPHHVTAPIVHGDMISVLPSPGHVISTPSRVISTPVVIPAVARTGSDMAYYNVPPNANVNVHPTATAIHPHKSKDEVYMVQVVKPVAPVMPVTPVMPIRSNEKRSAGQKCDVCSKKASFLCSGCQSAWYCGRNCQYNAWQEHSHRCNKRSQ